MKTVIAIDGPAASGKSTVARGVARELGYVWLNTGTFYRGATWWFLDRLGPDLSKENALSLLAGKPFAAKVEEGVARMDIGGCDPGPHTRSPEVNASVSPVSSWPEVRASLNSIFRELAESREIVAEGRDVGTVIFPDTPHKFYIDAAPEERERRRRAEGQKDAIAERDRLDSQRASAPLAIAEGATVLDTTHLPPAEVIDRVLAELAGAGIAPQSP